jgi:hypothetical protein
VSVRAQSDQRMGALRAELALSRELVGTLGAIAEAHDGVSQLTASLADGRREEAAGALVSLKGRVRALRAHAPAGAKDGPGAGTEECPQLSPVISARNATTLEPQPMTTLGT